MVVPHQIMKQLARKSSHISLVPPAADTGNDPPDTAPYLNEFFDGWLSTVSSTLTAPDGQHRSSQAIFGKRPLTSTDLTRVNRATVRESTDHRHWPAEVVQTFMVADVIKRNRK